MITLIIGGLITTATGVGIYIRESKLEKHEKKQAQDIMDVIMAIDKLRRGKGNTENMSIISVSPLGYDFAKYVRTHSEAKRFVENLEKEMKNNFKK